MVTYLNDGKIAYADGIRFVRDNKTGYYLSSKKIDGHRKRLHVFIWEKFNGPIPAGYQVHHRELDKSKNESDDLQLLPISNHLSLHSNLQDKDELRKRIAFAAELAKEWHHSEAGHDWHKEHYETMKDKFYVEHDFVCDSCGKAFKSTQTESRFCSNNCKSAWRRKQGYDNIERFCAFCGQPFTINKYIRKECCSKSCGQKLRRHQEHQSGGNCGRLQHAG